MSKAKCKDKYYLGLDIGTNSIGWAATDEYYNLVRKRSTDLWGSYLFEEGKSKKDQRIFRSARRRNFRKKNMQRGFLEDIFEVEVSKVDPIFYQRLYDSFYHDEDKHIVQKNSIFNDSNFDDKGYYKKYPTNYHLRSELLHDNSKKDIRLLYLVILNMLKRRGHFLFKGELNASGVSLDSCFQELNEYLRDIFDLEIDEGKVIDIEKLLKNKSVTGNDKKKALQKMAIFNGDNKKQSDAIISAITGLTFDLKSLFVDDKFGKEDKISFSEYPEDKEDEFIKKLDSDYEFIELLQAIYNWSVFSTIWDQSQFKYLSDAMKDVYYQHKNDLKDLRKFIKKHIPEEYDNIFNKTVNKYDNYVAYAGKLVINKKKQVVNYRCNHEKFLKCLDKEIFIKAEKRLTSIGLEFSEWEKELQNRVKSGSFLVKQRGARNSTIPYQVNLKELKEILENQKCHHSFLLDMDEEGITNIQKIISIFEFRVPYYVGPLNSTHEELNGNSWMEKKMQARITPWNFDKIINVEVTAEKFINRMTNRCTYLYGEDVLPKHSLLFQKFVALNTINNLVVNNEKISVENKQKIYNELLEQKENVSFADIRKFLTIEGIIGKTDELAGVDKEDKSLRISLSTYHKFKKINILNTRMVDELVRVVALFGSERKMLSNILKKRYSDKLSNSQIDEISKFKMEGWGMLSRTFLNEIEAVRGSSGEVGTIMYFLWNSNDNLMQVLSRNYNFKEVIDDLNADVLSNDSLEKDIANMKLAPAVTKMVRKTFVSLISEICKINGGSPDTFFVETTRNEGEKKRTLSRHKQLIDLYKKCKQDSSQIFRKLENSTNNDLRSKKLYLYYIQQGKCMYSGECIDLEKLFDDLQYDIDHIYPRSKVKDDSIMNNLALVKKHINKGKSSDYPISEDIQDSMGKHWIYLLEQGFITREKYNRLVRKEALSAEEIAGFIERQLVETSQATKAVATLLKKHYPDSKVVYVKASHVSEFRKKYEFVKSREINDHHHAKDAYLNIVVGNVYNKKFANRRESAEEIANNKVSMNKMYDFDVKKAWTTIGENKSICIVKNTMSRNTVKVVREVKENSGGLFNQTINKKVVDFKKSIRIPLKSSKNLKRASKYGQFDNIDALKDFSKYGYYDSVSVSHNVLVKIKTKKGEELQIVPVFVYMRDLARKSLVEYCETVLGISDVEIIVPKIGYNTVFSINGRELAIAGKSNNNSYYNSTFQLVLDEETYNYIHKIGVFVSKMRESIKKEEDKYVYQNPYYTEKRKDNSVALINDKKLIEVYSILVRKFETSPHETVFGDGNNAYTKLISDEAHNKFVMLHLYDKCEIIVEMIKHLKCDAQLGKFDRIIGSNGARISLSNNFFNNDKYKKISIISNSPTGFYRKEVKIK